MKQTFLPGGWAALKEHGFRLWKRNLVYVLCMAPWLIAGYLFFVFHAYVFLVLCAALLMAAGPAILAAHAGALDAVRGNTETCHGGFFAAYGAYFRQGILLGTALAMGATILGLPVYFAMNIGSSMAPLLMGVAGMWLLFWLSASSQFLTCLCTGKPRTFAYVMGEILKHGGICVVFGCLKLALWGLCVLVPFVGIVVALLGVPTFLRFIILYYLYAAEDKNG